MNGVLVTGTDTGVGKTAVAAGLLRVLREEGLRVAPFKPVESGHVGASADARGDASWPADAACLRDAAGTALARDAVVPYVFAEPLAPAVAARRAGAAIDPRRLDAAWHALRSTHDLVVVEGAGGLLVPVTDDLLVADLADRWGLPLVVVARPGLGTINHAALTVAAARARGLEVLGVVVNGMPATPGAAEATNPAEIARVAQVPVLGVLPALAGVDTAAGRWQPMAAAVRDHLDLAPLRALARPAAPQVS